MEPSDLHRVMWYVAGLLTTTEGLAVTEIKRKIQMHFSGGLRGSNWDPSTLNLWPMLAEHRRGEPCVLEINNIPSGELLNAIHGFGVRWIGIEELAITEGLNVRMWHPFNYGRLDRFKQGSSSEFWSKLSTSLMLDGDNDGAELTRKISFQARASGLRIRDVSNEYNKQLRYAVHSGEKNFSNIEVEGLYLAMHSFLYEICSHRDFLAAFISSRIFDECHQMQYMSKLSKWISKTAIQHELASIIQEETGKIPKPGWIALLSEYRNYVAHVAPLHHIASKRHLQRTDFLRDGVQISQINFRIPANPCDPNDNSTRDALDIFFDLYLKMEEFSCHVASLSGITPRVHTFTDKDIISFTVHEVVDMIE